MENSKKNISFNYIWQRYGTVGILIGLLAILAILKPGSILDPKSISQILTQSSVNILLAVGEFFAILIAGIDLSVGSVAALTGMIVAKLMVNGTSPSVAILVGIFTGAFIGFINGILVNKTKLHPFIITLGTQSIFRGLTLIISKARSVFGFPVSFTKGISNKILGIPVPVIIALVVALLLAYFTTRCKAGRNIYALGGNKGRDLVFRSKR